MLALASHSWRPPIRRTIAVVRPPAIKLEAMLILSIFLIGGLIWLAVGAAVMRGAPSPGPRIGPSL